MKCMTRTKCKMKKNPTTEGISYHIAENGKSWSYKYGKLHPGCYTDPLGIPSRSFSTQPAPPTTSLELRRRPTTAATSSTLKAPSSSSQSRARALDPPHPRARSEGELPISSRPRTHPRRRPRPGRHPHLRPFLLPRPFLSLSHIAPFVSVRQ